MEHADDLKPALEHANKRVIRRHPSSEFQIHHSTNSSLSSLLQQAATYRVR